MKKFILLFFISVSLFAQISESWTTAQQRLARKGDISDSLKQELKIDSTGTSYIMGSLAVGQNTTTKPLTVNGEAYIDGDLSVNNLTMTVGNVALKSVGVGIQALDSLTTGHSNTAFGWQSMLPMKDGDYNTSIGRHSMFGNVSGSGNSALGSDAMGFLLGDFNTAVGYDAGHGSEGVSVCTAMTAVGKSAGHAFGTNTYGVMVGYHAGYGGAATYNSDYDVFIGAYSATNYLGGIGKNTMVGGIVGRNITTGSSNTFLGYSAGNHASQKLDVVNSMALGNEAYTTKDNQVVIGNSSVVETVLSGEVKVPSMEVSTAWSSTALKLRTYDYVFTTTGSQLDIGFGASAGNTYGKLQVYDVGGNSNADLVLQAGGGNVGIGTTTPDEKFEVEFGTANKDVEIGVGTTDTDITFITLRSPNGTKYYITVDDAGNLTTSVSKP